jgi:hypothetical protein
MRIDLLDATLRVRSVARPLALAAILLVLRLLLTESPKRVTATVESLSRVVFGAVLCAGLLGWISFLSMTCGGADSYGYVSAAERLLAGTVVQDEPLARILPFPDAISAATPLGYTPSTQTPGASVPVYPLGLPALMAAAIVIAGRDGPFFVAPMMGLMLLAAIYVCAFRLTSDRPVALLATALTAVNPLVFTYAIQPMSDVPAAAFFVAAVAGLVREQPRPLLAGVAAAACLLIRPALAPALALLVALPYFVHGRVIGRAAAWFALPFTCGVVLQLVLQWQVYGHPLANGYAEMGALFSLDRVATNARSHAYWAWRALGPVFIGASAIGLSIVLPAARLTIGLVLGGVAAPHLVYRTFDHWETLRFLLPALVLLTIPAAAAVDGLSRRVAGQRLGLLLAPALALAIAAGWVSWLHDQTVFTMPERETRYRMAGALVTQATPPQAVILAALHSGSIRYYAARLSANWERIPAGALPSSIAALRDAGHPVYLLLDGDEERSMFEARHGSIAAWLPGGQRRNVQLLEAPQ